MLYYFFLAAFSVGTGFIVHELGHKVVAQHYGCFAEFRANGFMLMLAIIMSFFGFLFAAPGAVMIHGPVGVRRNGKISMAGPLMNLILAVIFLSNLLIFPFTGFLQALFSYGFMINTWLCLFNLIPILNFDGKKILAWNKLVYGSIVAGALILLFVQSTLFSF
jgi:Zn-dependent protease